ncbi:MAG: hypothetical protein HY781_03870 [Chloroflexi bacterium]|nr:hypothetical protein [Chloroflexota bacterium]
MAKPKRLPRKNRKRPIAVTIIVLLAIGEIILRLYWVVHYALQTEIWLNSLPWPLWEANRPTGAGLEFATAAFRLLWLLVGTAVLIGLLRMRRWSWVVLVFWVSVSLSIGIIHYFYRSLSAFNPSDYAVMAADMVLVFALNQSDVQRIYGIRRDDVEQIG